MSDATTFLFVCIVIALLIGVYNLWMMKKIMYGVWWILTHVHVVSKSQKDDPELKQIKRTFGIEDPPDEEV